MTRTTLLFGLVGAAVAALTLPLTLDPLWLLVLSGPLLAIALASGDRLSHSNRLSLRQVMLLALLYVGLTALVVPTTWRIANPIIVTRSAEIDLQPTLGIQIAGVLVLVSFWGVLGGGRGPAALRRIAIASLTLVVAEALAFMLELRAAIAFTAHHQPLTTMLMASFAVLCGYVGRESQGVPASRTAASGSTAAPAA